MIVRFSLLLLFLLLGCDGKSGAGVPKEVHWDRDMCVRCAMVVSDKPYAAQVLDPSSGKHYMYDDIGCAVLWLIEEKIPWAEQAKIWVKNLEDQEWIDAKTARYTAMDLTPMGFGFGAHRSDFNATETIDYAEMARRVIAFEQRR
ncbi:MAG: hypothetical protein JXK05_06955 [Campylobacterales bacterium]|nr:hypothetical protein [Campylobacterales bacterium]